MNLKIAATYIISLLLFGCYNKENKPRANTKPPAKTRNTFTHSESASSFSRNKSSTGQLIYVPVYSHIYQQDRKKTFNLTATLSIRNTDPFRSLNLTKVSYYDSKGKLIQQYLDNALNIKAQASKSYVVEERDLRGGVGANFLVRWRSGEAVTPPVVQAVMISTSQQQGISFLSRGRVLEEDNSGEGKSE